MLHVKHLSRRRFLTIASLIAGVSAAGAVQRWGIGPLASLGARIYDALKNPGLRDATTGLLDVGALRALLATTEALVVAAVETSHYEDLFRWRAENLGGYRALYERFAAVVDRAAKEAGKPDFASCDMKLRREILQRMKSRAYAVVFERDELRFETYIFRQILVLFSRTDAWILLGYESWPGTPRGLQAYAKAPRKA